jgi:hypothetical protein
MYTTLLEIVDGGPAVISVVVFTHYVTNSAKSVGTARAPKWPIPVETNPYICSVVYVVYIVVYTQYVDVYISSTSL